MNSIVLDSETISSISARFGETIDVRDDTGKVHMTIIARPKLTLEELKACFTPEQLARRADWSRPGIPHDVVARQLGLE